MSKKEFNIDSPIIVKGNGSEQQWAELRELLHEFLDNQPPAEMTLGFDTSRNKLVTGSSNPKLAIEIGDYLGRTPDEAVTVFHDKSPKVRLNDGVDGNTHIFAIQTLGSPDISRATIELLLILDAAKRMSPGKVTAVIPFDGFQRSDRIVEEGQPISASLIASILETAGANEVLHVDPHFPQLQGFYRVPTRILHASTLLMRAVQKKLPELDINDNLVFTAPDAGSAKHVQKLSRISPFANSGIAQVNKERPRDGDAESFGFMGDVKGRYVLICDELIDTFGSVVQTANLAVKNGAKGALVMATHALWSEVESEDATKRKMPLQLLTESPHILRVFTTDTIAHREEVRKHSKIEIVPIAPLLGEAIRLLSNGKSIYELNPNTTEEYLTLSDKLKI